MKRINFKLSVIVTVMLLILVGLAAFYGCSGDDNSLQPTTRDAAHNLHDRFAELFEDSGEYDGNENETASEPAVPAVAMHYFGYTEERANISPPATAAPVTTENYANADDNNIMSGFIADYDYEVDDYDEYVEADEPDLAENVYIPAVPLELFAITPTGRRFHFEHCHHARNASELLTREAAEARGFTPCGTCRPVGIG